MSDRGVDDDTVLIHVHCSRRRKVTTRRAAARKALRAQKSYKAAGDLRLSTLWRTRLLEYLKSSGAAGQPNLTVVTVQAGESAIDGLHYNGDAGSEDCDSYVWGGLV